MNCLKLATLSFMTSLIAASAFASQGVYGTWKFPDVNQGGLSMVATLTIAPNLVTSRATCTINNQSTSVTASAAANITPSQIQVTGSARQDSTSAVPCNVDIEPSTLDYNLSADDHTLTITAGAQSIALTRQQKP